MNEDRHLNLQKAVDILSVARLDAMPMEDLPIAIRPDSVARSYILQQSLNQTLTASELGRCVGYKIGCTTTVMQQYLGIEHPCAGSMFESMVRFGEGVFSARDLCRPGVECEIAVQIEKDMPDGIEYSISDCDNYVGVAMASIELVDDRWNDYTKVSTPTLIADNFFSAGCVLGPAVTASSDQLQQANGSMMVNGHRIGSGKGADILGHPYAALCWLANHLNHQDSMLRAGDYVSLGSVVQTYWLSTGDVVEVDFGPLGRCSLSLD